MNILIVEDEKNMSQIITLELEHVHYICDHAFDGEEGLQKALMNDYDLILLDLMLPRMNGVEVCRRLRLEKQTPIIMLTARDSVMDKVNGLHAGADDYVPKPFAIEELLARMSAILRRIQPQTLKLIHHDIILDKEQHKVFAKDEEVPLTTTEYDLLSLLIKEAEKVVSKEMILREVWGYESDVESNVVEVYIRYLRNKVAGIDIETVRGVGYRLR